MAREVRRVRGCYLTAKARTPHPSPLATGEGTCLRIGSKACDRHALSKARRWLRAVAATCLALAACLPAAYAQPSPTTTAQPVDINDNTVGIVTGTVSGTYIQFASDLSSLLDSPGKLRILAVLGKGSMQNVEDIMKVRGIDLGIVQSDVLAYIKKRGLLPDAVNRLQYITKLYNEEFHLLARADIRKLEDLRGQKVNFGTQGSGIAITASIVFDLLKIKVEPVYDDPAIALEKLKQGEIAACIGVYGKPAKLYDGLKPEDKVRFLAVPPSLELSEIYFPSTLTARDYPNLIAADARVETIAVGAVMVVYGWEPGHWRYNKVARFVDLFFTNFEQLQKPPRHPKWQEVNLVAKVPAWTRFPAAEDWLRRAVATTASPGKSDGDRAAFERFLTETSGGKAAGGDEEARLKLLQAYDAWKKSQAK
ncbi:TAXI family TRAP transporter solute-binding subunit [Rhodomicrobium sp. R_RK_3]|uniref:TAXI family TRAP transporter solute-binding subunit n=1 Tax=Rhodomicrobium sp. R_RK_3 TaxID=2029567 RepID=UPI001AEC9913|nr:TAXI family TRAP transporter solute-binding subunit [Rhodomicrobium sp. R_RK_3]